MIQQQQQQQQGGVNQPYYLRGTAGTAGTSTITIRKRYNQEEGDHRKQQQQRNRKWPIHDPAKSHHHDEKKKQQQLIVKNYDDDNNDEEDAGKSDLVETDVVHPSVNTEEDNSMRTTDELLVGQGKNTHEKSKHENHDKNKSNNINRHHQQHHQEQQHQQKNEKSNKEEHHGSKQNENTSKNINNLQQKQEEDDLSSSFCPPLFLPSSHYQQQQQQSFSSPPLFFQRLHCNAIESISTHPYLYFLSTITILFIFYCSCCKKHSLHFIQRRQQVLDSYSKGEYTALETVYDEILDDFDNEDLSSYMEDDDDDSIGSITSQWSGRYSKQKRIELTTMDDDGHLTLEEING